MRTAAGAHFEIHEGISAPFVFLACGLRRLSPRGFRVQHFAAAWLPEDALGKLNGRHRRDPHGVLRDVRHREVELGHAARRPLSVQIITPFPRVCRTLCDYLTKKNRQRVLGSQMQRGNNGIRVLDEHSFPIIA